MKIEIVIPEGVKPGSEFTLTDDSGDKHKFNYPRGSKCKPGSKFLVEMVSKIEKRRAATTKKHYEKSFAKGKKMFEKIFPKQDSGVVNRSMVEQGLGLEGDKLEHTMKDITGQDNAQVVFVNQFVAWLMKEHKVEDEDGEGEAEAEGGEEERG